MFCAGYELIEVSSHPLFALSYRSHSQDSHKVKYIDKLAIHTYAESGREGTF